MVAVGVAVPWCCPAAWVAARRLSEPYFEYMRLLLSLHCYSEVALCPKLRACALVGPLEEGKGGRGQG